jgi:lysophospholipase L1-like esterase
MNRGVFATHWLDWKEIRGRDAGHRHRMDRILGDRPTLLYFGDSWFSTPLYPNLARQSIEAIDGMAMIHGKPGATSKDLLDRSEKIERLADYLEWYAFDALLISLGGNDAIDKLASLFEPGDEEMTPEEAFAHVESSRVFEYIFDRYHRLLDRLSGSSRLPAHFRVIVHGYAPPVRIGVPAELTPQNVGLIGMVIRSTGPWIWGPMRYVLADKEAARRFAKALLVDGFMERVLQPLKVAYPSLLDVVDLSASPAMQRPESWFDEIHPNTIGFAAMAARLNAAIRRGLPADKRAAVPAG